MLKKYVFLFMLVWSGLKAEEQFYLVTGNNSWELAEQNLLDKAKTEHGWLNTAPCYINKKQNFEHIQFTETLEIFQPVLFKLFYLCRNSAKAVLVVPPFGGNAIDIVHYTELFKEYDVYLLDYNYSAGLSSALSPQAVSALSESELSRKQIAIEFSLFWMRDKEYLEVIACSQCYGAWLTLLVQEQLESLKCKGFDKLIIDSCPAGSFELMQKFIENPWGLLTLGRRTSRFYLNCLPKWQLIQEFINGIKGYCCFPKISMQRTLSNISVPLLFVHGQNDMLVDDLQFKTMYEAVPHKLKTALITPYMHLHHSLKAKELYRECVLKFLNE